MGRSRAVVVLRCPCSGIITNRASVGAQRKVVATFRGVCSGGTVIGGSIRAWVTARHIIVVGAHRVVVPTAGSVDTRGTPESGSFSARVAARHVRPGCRAVVVVVAATGRVRSRGTIEGGSSSAGIVSGYGHGHGYYARAVVVV